MSLSIRPFLRTRFTFSAPGVVGAATLLFAVACSDAGTESEPTSEPTSEVASYSDATIAEEWTTETHSNDVAPNLAEVFNDTVVKRIDLVIGEENWTTMVDDMTENYGEFGATSASRGGASPGGASPGGASPGGASPTGGTPAGEAVSTATTDDPVFVPAQVLYNGRQWFDVGVRFKGNSSLQSAWQSGNLKISFKLDFDEFEDNNTALKNQRFFGIKKLSLKNNYNDPAVVREKVMADLFADAGLVVSHTSFYEVYVDRGDGAEYFGVYTMTEEVDDSVLTTQYDDEDGNLYKPDGDAASFSVASYNGSVDEEVFVKETNEDEADFADIAALYAILHDPSRETDPEGWRMDLDAIFDTDVFLHYLAINTVAQNWDTYGRMTHNYFLYADPATSKLTWIPWDNNEALDAGKRDGSLALDFSDLDSAGWPLISFLYADAVYRARYDGYVEEFINGVFAPAVMAGRYDTYAKLLAPFVAAEQPGATYVSSEAEFDTAIATLKSHARARADAANAYLGN